MPSGFQSPIVRVTTRFLNTVNDSSIGGVVADISGIGQAPGQLGSEVWLDENSPTAYDSAVGTLYPGCYKYVHLLSTSVQPAYGEILFWATPSSKTNPYDVSRTVVDGNQAGVYINASSGAKALTPGNYGYIQTRGTATVLFGTITKATPAVKDLVFCTSAANTADVIADATAITSPILKRLLGVAEVAPVSAATSVVMLEELRRNV